MESFKFQMSNRGWYPLVYLISLIVIINSVSLINYIRPFTWKYLRDSILHCHLKLFFQTSRFHTQVKFWVASQWDPLDSFKHYRLWLMVLVTLHNLMVRPYCWRYHNLIIMGHGENYMVLKWKLCPGWILFIGLEGTVHATRGGMHHTTHLQKNLLARYAHCCNCVVPQFDFVHTIWAIKHLLVGCKTCFMRCNLYLTPSMKTGTWS